MITHQSQARNLSQNLINFISQFHALLLCFDLFHTFSYLTDYFLVFIDNKSSMHHMNLNYLIWMNFLLRKTFLIFVILYSNEIFGFLQFFYFFLCFS